MAEQQDTTIPLRGLDWATPGHHAEEGACRTLENLVPTGGNGDIPAWTIPRAPTTPGVGSLLSIGRHTEGRLIGLRAGELVVIDPSSSYAEQQVWSFEESDATRRATMATIGEDTIVCITAGSGLGRGELLLRVRNAEAIELNWPLLPEASITWTELNGEDLLPTDTYVFQLAWRLSDGTTGPATLPMRSTPTGGTGQDGWEATISIERQPEPLSAGMDTLIDGLLLIAHAATTDDSGAVTQRAIEAPGYVVDVIEAPLLGTEFTWSDSKEGIFASRQYVGTGLAQHDRTAGAAYTYNKRLILGDVEYDLQRPSLMKHVVWEEGVSNANGDDWHLIYRVEVETPTGPVTRLSEPLPYDATHAADVETKWGLFSYADPRASGFELAAASDYTGSIEDATWRKVATGKLPRSFQDAAGATYAYRLTTGDEPFDITVSSGPTSLEDRTDWTDSLSASATINGCDGVTLTDADSSDATLDLSAALAGDVEEVSGVASIAFGTSGQCASTTTDGTVTIEIQDDAGTVLDSVTFTREGEHAYTLSSFTPADAEVIRVYTEAVVAITAESGAGNCCDAESEAKIAQMNAETTASGGGSVALAPSTATDRDGTRVVWSQTHRPFSLPVENLVYVGEDDTVMALQAVGQEISQAQFGEYPILVFSEASVHILRLGTDPFIEAVDLLTADMGIVGRRAAAPVDGAVAAALDGGVYGLAPQLEEKAVSEPLHDPGGDFLGDLGPETVLGHVKDAARSRDALRVSTSTRTYRYDLGWGAWSTLTQPRTDYAVRPGAVYGVTDAGDLVEELDNATDRVDVHVQTAVLPLAPIGSMARVFEVQLRQLVPLTSLDVTVVATDPDAAYVQLGTRTLKASDARRPGLLLSAGRAPDALVDAQGHGTPGQILEHLYVRYEVRRRRLRDHTEHGTTAMSPDTSIAW